MTQRPQHLTAETLERYRAQTLDPAGQLAARAHALACPECRARLSRSTDAGAALASLRDSFDFVPDDEPQHLTYEHLSALVDGRLDEVEREIVESHLAICAECETDARDLYRYQAIAEETPLVDASEPFAATETFPPALTLTATETETSPTSATEILPPAAAETSRRRWFTFDWLPSFGTSVPAAAMAALVVVLLVGLWAAYRMREQKTVERARVEQAPTGDSDLPTVATTATPESPRPTATTGEPPSSNQLPPSGQNLSPAAPDSATANNAPPTRSNHRHGAATATANPPATVALIDGRRRVTFDGAGNLSGLEELSPGVRRAVTNALINGNVETPRALDNLAGSTGVLMGDSADAGSSSSSGVPFALVAPVGRVVRKAQPTFSWRPLSGASGYTVAVVDAKFNVVEQSEPLTTTVWTPSKPLARGVTYSWQVTALRDGAEVVSPSAPAPQAKFKVLEQDLADELARVEEAHADSPLVRGVFYARAGLLDEARREFQDLAEANPRSPVARKLLRSVRRK